ncbi:MAG: hypothetical protein FWF66_01395 [Candidatus Bathyarchaeota archaeon]|nr:hypothetical protein [Candidatus Termiticorpusculum sp.]
MKKDKINNQIKISTTKKQFNNIIKSFIQPVQKHNFNKNKEVKTCDKIPPLFYVFKFRPSSHSEEYSIIANYPSKQQATQAQKTVEQLLEDMAKNPSNYKVDWSPDEAELLTWDDKVSFRVYTAGYLENIETALQEKAKPSTINYHVNYQELTISVKLPKNLTLQAASLVLDREQVKAIEWLNNNIGSPKITQTKDSETYVWVYDGDELYRDGYLYLNFDFAVDEKDNWLVENHSG